MCVSEAILKVRQQSAQSGACMFVQAMKPMYVPVFNASLLHSPVGSYLCMYICVLTIDRPELKV